MCILKINNRLVEWNKSYLSLGPLLPIIGSTVDDVTILSVYISVYIVVYVLFIIEVSSHPSVDRGSAALGGGKRKEPTASHVPNITDVQKPIEVPWKFIKISN